MNRIFGCVSNNSCIKALSTGLNFFNQKGENNGVSFKSAKEIFAIRLNDNVNSLMNKISKFDGDVSVILAQSSNFVRSTKESAIAPSANNLFAVAIDGFVENFDYLKQQCKNPFNIESDEDLILALLCILNNSDKLQMISKISQAVVGSPSFAFFSKDEDALYCYRGKAPLYVGVGNEGGFVSSEVGAFADFCTKYFYLSQGECAKITGDKVTIFDKKCKKIKKQPLAIAKSEDLKINYSVTDQLYYCPIIVKEAFNTYVKNGKIEFDDFKLSRHNFDRIKRIVITGCGTSFNVAQAGAWIIETMTAIDTYAINSTQLICSPLIFDKETMLIAISYNGENIATSACAQRAKNNGAKTLAITSNSSSFLSHICDYKITSKNSFGDGDSSLKSFVFSYFTMCMLSLYLGRKSDVISEIYLNVSIKMAEMLSGKISSSIKNSPLSEMCSNIILDSDSVFVTGLGQDAFFAKEACQKLKSLADIPSIYCPLDSLEEEVSRANNCTVVAIISDKNVLQKVIYCLRRARALGAQVIIVTVSNVEEEIQDFANILSTDSSVPIFNPLTCISSIYKLATTIKEIKSTPASIA